MVHCLSSASCVRGIQLDQVVRFLDFSGPGDSLLWPLPDRLFDYEWDTDQFDIWQLQPHSNWSATCHLLLLRLTIRIGRPSRAQRYRQNARSGGPCKPLTSSGNEQRSVMTSTLNAEDFEVLEDCADGEGAEARCLHYGTGNTAPSSPCDTLRRPFCDVTDQFASYYYQVGGPLSYSYTADVCRRQLDHARNGSQHSHEQVRTSLWTQTLCCCCHCRSRQLRLR